jgi:hypothetical protein
MSCELALLTPAISADVVGARVMIPAIPHMPGYCFLASMISEV